MKVRKLVYVMLFFLLILSISTGLKVFADSDECESSEEMLDGENLNDGHIENDLKSFPPVIDGEDGNGNSPLGLPPVIDNEDGNGNSPLGLPPVIDDEDGNGNSPLGLPPVIDNEDGNGNSPLGLPPVIDDDGNGNSPLNNPKNDEQ